MANGVSYPRLPDSRWWALRNHFKRTVPKEVTPNLVASVLGIKPASAGGVLVALKQLGLLDQAGTPTSLANDWRDDSRYSEACRAILESVYPQELLDVAPPPAPDRALVQGWFARALQTGQENARQLAAMYVLIASGKVPDDSAKPATKSALPAAAPARSGRGSQLGGGTDVGRGQRRSQGEHAAERPAAPKLQVAIQVNISPDLTPEQIDQVFKSMADHLYAPTEV
ncbi:MAG: DUF5343 domain-containing protein [Dehalococcoidia bacterium]